MVDQVATAAGEAVPDAPAPTVFRRSPAAQVGGVLGAGIGALLFGGFAVVVFSGLLMEDLAARLLYGGMIASFGALMGVSAIAALRRGRDSRVAEIGPNGAWTPEMGFVPWAEMAEVRLESVAGLSGPRNSRLRHHRRLGFAPRDGGRRPASAARLARNMTQAYLALVRMLAPGARLGDVELAPFGVSEADLPGDFDRVLEVTRRHIAVTEPASPPA